MPTPVFPTRYMDTKQLFNRCFETITGPNPDELGALRVSVSGITIPSIAVDLNCLTDSVQICADNGTLVEGIKSNANNHLLTAPAPPIRSEETDQSVGVDLAFTSAVETSSYNIVFIGVARTVGSENFLLDISVKRGSVLHPVYRKSSLINFVTLTDNLKLTAGEQLVVSSSGITASTLDLTIIKEVV